jgi:alkylation response protein AidB-like acyl-CoA dehydrogenase
MLDQGKPALHEAAIAKLVGAEWSWQTVDECFQMFGGNAYINGEYMIERLWRDLRVARIYDGSSEVQQMLIAQQLRKGNVQTPW